jgi:DNA-binding protein Fis
MTAVDAIRELTAEARRLADAVLVASSVASIQQHAGALSSLLERVRQIAAVEDPAMAESLEEVQRRKVMMTMKSCGGNRKLAAGALGINPATLSRKLQRWGKKRGGTTKPRPDMDSSRECDICGGLRPMSEFAPDLRSPDGISKQCDACVQSPAACLDRAKRRKNVWGV